MVRHIGIFIQFIAKSCTNIVNFLCRAEGLNHVVKEDVVDDAESPIIVDMACIDEEFEKV